MISNVFYCRGEETAPFQYLTYSSITNHSFYCLKGQFTPKSKIHLLSIIWAVYLSRLFRSESQCFGDIGCGDVRFLLNAMEVDGTRLVVLKAPKNDIHFKKKNNKKNSRSHNPQSLFQFHLGSIFFHRTRERGSTHGWEASMLRYIK